MSGFVDLHVHSQASDGTMTVEEIVREAVARGVSLLAITDHETMEACQALKALAPEGLRCIEGVELACNQAGQHLHVLAYGVEPEDPGLRALMAHNRRALDGLSERLAEILGHSVEDLRGFSYDRTLGGWQGLHFLMAQGAGATMMEVFALYAAHEGCRYEDANFRSLGEIIQVIHQAGGKAVLAHPGDSLRELGPEALVEHIERLLPLGLDGVECFYPKHSKEITAACVALCQRKNLLITTGSDCHGSFSGAPLGSLEITEDQLCLDGLI